MTAPSSTDLRAALVKAREALVLAKATIMKEADPRGPAVLAVALINESITAIDAALSTPAGIEPTEAERYIACDEPLTSTAEPEIINSIRLVTPAEAAAFTRRVHPDHTYTDDEAIAEYMIVNWAWWWEPSAAHRAAYALRAAPAETEADWIERAKRQAPEIDKAEVAFFDELRATPAEHVLTVSKDAALRVTRPSTPAGDSGPSEKAAEAFSMDFYGRADHGPTTDAIKRGLTRAYAIDHPRSSPAEAGFVRVPVDPDDSQIEAGYEALTNGQEWGRKIDVVEIYAAMLAAAPPVPASDAVGKEREGSK